jgi:hypothetical protein
MKKIATIGTLCALLFTACKLGKAENKGKEAAMTDFISFGDQISTQKALSANEMFKRFQTLEVGNPISVKFAATINEVCASKGCRMKRSLDANTQTMVRFKDYRFFMPLDAKDKEVIVQRIAYITQNSEAELRHYTEDARKTTNEIAKIT